MNDTPKTTEATEDAEWMQPEYFTVCTDESYREQQDAVSFKLATAYRDRQVPLTAFEVIPPKGCVSVAACVR